MDRRDCGYSLPKNSLVSRTSRAIADSALREAIERADRGLIDANLGGGLIKQRVARLGQGRSGGYRTLIAFRSKERSFFMYGFAKNERDNVSDQELAILRATAAVLMALDGDGIDAALKAKELQEVA
jgi:hypothetical protein